jgi:hypothetical protein
MTRGKRLEWSQINKLYKEKFSVGNLGKERMSENLLNDIQKKVWVVLASISKSRDIPGLNRINGERKILTKY